MNVPASKPRFRIEPLEDRVVPTMFSFHGFVRRAPFQSQSQFQSQFQHQSQTQTSSFSLSIRISVTAGTTAG